MASGPLVGGGGNGNDGSREKHRWAEASKFYTRKSFNKGSKSSSILNPQHPSTSSNQAQAGAAAGGGGDTSLHQQIPPPPPPVNDSDDDSSSLNRRPNPNMSKNNPSNGHRRVVTINLSSRSRHEVRDLRSKLTAELDQVRALYRKFDSRENHQAAAFGTTIPTRSQFSASDAALTSPAGSNAPIRRQLTVSVPENSVGEKEKRTPKANQYYRNSDFVLGKEKFSPADSHSHKKSKSNGSKMAMVDNRLYGQAFKSCASQLSKLMKHKHGWVFNTPVDVKALGLHDYHIVIKHPMDLGTVKSRLSKNWYKTPEEFAEDARLTFRNAMTYNPKGQDVHTMAEQLLQIFDQQWPAIEAEYTYLSSPQNHIGHFRSFCKSGEREVPWMEIRPHKHWEVPSHDAEVVMKVKLWPPVKGNISGVICLKLQNSAHDNFKTIMLPLEAKVDGKANYNSPTGAISLFFEPLVPCDGKGFVCTLSVRNSASHLLTIVSIAENFNVFEVRYLEGLLLYPDTITHVALISYSHPDVSEHIPTKFPWSSPGCKLSLLTNETSSPKIEIPCEALVQTCCKHGVESGFIPHESSFLGMKAQKDKLMNARTGSLGSLLEESFPLESKFLGLLEADRRILENWRSQGTMAKLSVLKDHDLLFPVVQIGTQYSKWITVHNPSQKPVVMQLVLNSGAIIDNCKYPDDSFKPSFKLISVESQDGFSMPETTTTEVILHPLGSAQIGPILFRPSKRCTWRSSALIRNNLSGVEWLPLQAFGGSHSLLLLEGSEAVNKIEFNLNLQSVLNASSSGLSLHMESRKKLCIHQLYKELYAKNAGELPVKVTRLEVSGIECGSDGFIIHNCKGFSLAPGESARLLISYQAYFSAAPLKRHLKLTTDTGFLVIPLEASHPVNLTDQCKKSLFWALIWKLPALVFTIVVIVCLLFFIRHAVASARKDYSIKSENTIAISMAEKSRVHRNARNFRPIKKNDKLDEGLAIDRYSRCENSALENTQKVKDRKDSEYQKKPALQSPPPTKIHIGTLDSSGETELPQSGNLTVKVVKERGRRRKRRTGGGLASKLEVSSSQSGNSTPSSPLSPDSFTPNSSFSSFGALVEEHSHEKKPDFSLAIKQTAPEPQRSIGRPVLLPSATFPGTSCRASGITTKLLASSSPLAPHARAPGSKLNNEKGRKTEEDEAYGKQYTYDIWGNHLCAHLMGKSKEITSKVFDASESDSQSFFTRDPQSLMMMSSAHSETPGHNLTPFDVDHLHQIK